jgi:cobalamin biosynthesis protein CobD/CbiB
MPKVMYNPEKVQKQKKIIGIVAIVLMLIVTVLITISRLRYEIPYIFFVQILLIFVVFGVASLLLRRVGKVPL